MHKIVWVVLCLFLSTELMAKKYALLVGVAKYTKSKDNLPGIRPDLTRMYNLLKSWGFKEKDIVVLQNSDSLKLDEYLQLYKELKSTDTFAFYYTGHGSFVKDKNNDEADGQDETLVLSNGKEDKHYTDDDLNYRLNAIQAKKLIIFDSCHSGTAHKAGSSEFVSKSMMSDFIGSVFQRIKQRNEPVLPNVLTGYFVKFSASKDNETSVATKDGSLFTTEMVKLLSQQKFLLKSLKNIEKNIKYEISAKSKRGRAFKKFSPVFVDSSNKQLDGSMEDFLE